MQTVLAVGVANCRSQVPGVRDIKRDCVVDATDLADNRIVPAIHSGGIPVSFVDQLQAYDTIQRSSLMSNEQQTAGCEIQILLRLP